MARTHMRWVILTTSAVYSERFIYKLRHTHMHVHTGIAHIDSSLLLVIDPFQSEQNINDEFMLLRVYFKWISPLDKVLTIMERIHNLEAHHTYRGHSHLSTFLLLGPW